jgi:glutamine amidotransferase
MCRWVTLLSSEPISLSDVVLAPSNSIVHQSRDATFHPGYDQINNAPLNADGFGVGWYHRNIAKIPDVVRPVSADGTVSKPGAAAPLAPATPIFIPAIQKDGQQRRTAAVFKDTFPAWNNLNLRELCMSTSSDCIMAHVRAASTGTGVSQNNCHPFKAGRLLFCHNGRVFGYQQIKRRFLAELSDEAFLHMRGTTDSEAVFGLILTILGRDEFAAECGSPLTQTKPFGEQRLCAAVRKALSKISQILDAAQLERRDYCTCNFALMDGETMVVTRYCDQSPEVPPPSLYFAFGNTLQEELTGEESEKALFNTVVEEKKEDMADCDNLGSSEEDDETASDSADDVDFEISKVLLNRRESKPGKILSDVNPQTATFVVSSNPLTRSHTWHKIPKNSIMWCTRGKHPELRLLNRRSPTWTSGLS